MMLNTKGSAVAMTSKVICFTSNAEWERWYPHQFSRDSCAALKRRLDEFGEFIKI